MKKSSRRRKGGVAGAAATPQKPALTRRQVLTRAGYGAAGVAVLGGGGFWFMGAAQATAAEHDLDRLGQGVPAVVQVHDPQCPVCTALQREARKALKGLDDADLVYLVADIKTPAGSAFAARHGAPHVTLLLFDGAGRLTSRLEGPRDADQLRPVFSAMARRG